jgi:2-keto-3-deoxy-L-rhamnonate aldolase RhmA
MSDVVKRVKSGQAVFGTMVRVVTDPCIAAIAKRAGLDFIMLDMEHGAYSLESVASIAAVAQAEGLGIFVRVPELSRGWVSRVLDVGAEGLMVPMLETPEEARNLAKWSKYPPLGGRGLSSQGGNSRYGKPDVDTSTYMAQSNDNVLAIAQIETVTGVGNVEKIIATPGIDALVVGPNDLAVSLGKPGECSCPEEIAAIERIAAAAKAAGKVFGIHHTSELLSRFASHGLRFFMNSLDISVLNSSLAALNKETRALHKG